MSPNLGSSFISYNLTGKDLESAYAFSTEQRALLQNLLAEAAEEKIALTFDPLNPQGFVQQEAELQGKIGILRYILSLSPSVLNLTSEQ